MIGTGATLNWVGLAFLALLTIFGVVSGVTQLAQRFGKRRRNFRSLFKDWFSADLEKLESHEKTYPSYDLVSVHRALAALLEARCQPLRTVGAVHALTNLLEVFQHLDGWLGMSIPMAPSFERLPVGVDEEVSVPNNILWLATYNGEKIAVMLATRTLDYPDTDGMDARLGPRMMLWVSIACKNKADAHALFLELEQRRRAVCIFRGQTIDPVVDGGGIRSIGFRALPEIEQDQLILTQEVKDLLQSSVLSFYAQRDRLEALGIEKKRGVLLHGPPGTGKTSLALLLARSLKDFTVCFVSGERLLYPRELCRMARYLQPTMIVFEDIDLIAEQRDRNGLATVLGELMNQMDGCEPDDEVLFVLNTNSLERLESAVKNRPGRIDQIIEVPSPDRVDRQRLFEHFARKVELKVERWDRLLEATEGATPALLKEVTKRAIVGALGSTTAEAPIVIGEDDLLLAHAQVRLLRDRGPQAGIGFSRSN